MFSPEMILGLLGISPEQVAHFQAMAPKVVQATYDADARLKRCEVLLGELAAAVRDLADGVALLAGTEAKRLEDQSDESAKLPPLVGMNGNGGH